MYFRVGGSHGDLGAMPDRVRQAGRQQQALHVLCGLGQGEEGDGTITLCGECS